MEEPFDQVQNIQRLRYEAFSKFATAINHCNDFNAVGILLAGQIKFIIDTFLFRVYFKFDQTHLTFTISRGSCSLHFGSDDRIVPFDQDALIRQLPLFFGRQDIEQHSLLSKTLFYNSKINSLIVLPVKNIGYDISLTNAVPSDNAMAKSDLKFLKLISDLLGNKLYQLSLVEKVANKNLQLEQKNIEINDLNLTLEDRVNLRTSELKQANLELQSLFYSATHDFRTPVTNILGLVNLGELCTEDQDILLLFDGCRQAVSNLDKTLRKLNSMSFYENHYNDFEEFRISDVIKDVSHTLDNKNVSIIISGQCDGVILSHKRMLSSIFENLVENSMVFCRQNPEIKINILSQNGDYIIHYSDNGIGISDAITNKIFNMFYRGSELSRGSGLGLFVVKKLLRHLGGNITLEKGTDCGTIFHLILPFYQSSQGKYTSLNRASILESLKKS
ncbi:sensor histidine kinase [Mucilaginibacter sp. UYCu711]|uniref:sensor histidine kinase n=1 Tax=Mucilaginibacter sp. UYCu711 TaxID=3156339 RepID=UPI003D1C377C